MREGVSPSFHRNAYLRIIIILKTTKFVKKNEDMCIFKLKLTNKVISVRFRSQRTEDRSQS